MRDTGGKNGMDCKEDIEMKDKEDKMDKMDKMEDQYEDQYLSAVGNIGKWQLRNIYISHF